MGQNFNLQKMNTLNGRAFYINMYEIIDIIKLTGKRTS